MIKVVIAVLLCLPLSEAYNLTSAEESAVFKESVLGILVRIESLLERMESRDDLLMHLAQTVINIGRDVVAIKDRLGGNVDQEPEEEEVEEIITDPKLIGNAQMRLVGGDGSRGRLEVLHPFRGGWGTVCDDDFTDADAAVICKHLGLAYGNAKEIHNFGGGYSLPILLDNVNCPTQDARYCTHRGWGIHNCETSENLGIECR